MMLKLFKSVIEQDTAPIVICDTNSTVVYMNPSAIKRYRKDLTGYSIKDCHNADSNKKIDKVLDWFLKSENNNIVHTYYNDKQNKDAYIIALRDDDGTLIGYYEKHEFRTRDNSPLYEGLNL